MAMELHGKSDKLIQYCDLKRTKAFEGLKHYSLHHLSGTVPTGGVPADASVKE